MPLVIRRKQSTGQAVTISSVFDTAQGPGATAQESADLHGALAEGISVHHLGEGYLASMPKRDRPGDPSCSRIRARTVVLDFPDKEGNSLAADCRTVCLSHRFTRTSSRPVGSATPSEPSLACPQGVIGLLSAHRSDIRRPAVESP